MNPSGYLLVAVGGGAGACARFAVGAAVASRGWPSAVGTGVVNVVGCFCIGLLYARTEDPNLRRLLGVGVLGGFTTFSSFGRETLELMAAGRPGAALGSVALNLGLGMAGVWLGQRLGA